MSKIKVRSIFVSDIHIGSKHAKVGRLRAFLKQFECEYLYLVGDIIDIWKMQRGKTHFDPEFPYLVRNIIGLMKEGTKVIWVPGNHDEILRQAKYNFLNLGMANFSMMNSIVHETAEGRKMLVVHGDIFDRITGKISLAYHLGDRAYTFALTLNYWINTLRVHLGWKPYSLSRFLKHNVKKAASWIDDFEVCLSNYAKDLEADGVICGHIHTPEMKFIDNVEYYNCGDWIESCTAVIEDLDGSLRLTSDQLDQSPEPLTYFDQ